MIGQWSLIELLTPMTKSVIAGSGLSPSMSLKICSNRGTMKTSRKVMIATARNITMIGIDHRGDDFVLDLLRLLLELRQTGQDEFEHAAELAGAHHVDVKIVEDFRMLREAFGEGAAALHGIGQTADRAS